MKANITSLCTKGLVLTTILCGLQLHALAADVTGDRLNIGTGHTLPAVPPNAQTYSSIAGGGTNTVNSRFSFIGGGGQNYITNGADFSVIAGGNLNTSDASYSTIAGGYDNLIINNNNGTIFVGGGFVNVALGDYSAITGGEGNYVDGEGSYVGGGQQCIILGSQSSFSTIAGGSVNTIYTNGAYIGGGYQNTVYQYYGTTSGGYFNTNNGEIATIGGGAYNLAEGDYSVIAGGATGRTTLYGQSAHASGSFVVPPDQGDAQTSEYVVRNVTANTNSTELFLDGASLRMVMPTNGTWSFDILVAVRGTNSESGGFHTNGVIKRSGASIALVGSVIPVNVPAIAVDNVSWKVFVSADSGDGALAVKVNGDSSTNRWVATVRTTEVKF